MFDGLLKFQQTFFDIHLIAHVLPGLLRTGLPNTILLAVFASLIGLVLGLVIAICLLSHYRWLHPLCRWYIDILRGLPHILTIYVVGQGLPLAGLALFGNNTYAYAALAIGLIESAYMAEILRAGLQSVDKGQIQAARSLGMSSAQALRYIVLPQGIRRVLPPLTGQFILVIKGTALVFLLGLTSGQRELFSIAQDSAVNNANLSPLTAAGLIYLALTIPMTRVVNAWERRIGVSSRSLQADA